MSDTVFAMRSRHTALSALLVLTACSPAPEPKAPPASAPVASASAGPSALPVAPTLPPGVLAELPGPHGAVRVEERDGLRMLTVGGAVQGARRLDADPSKVPGDPLVDIALAAAPRAKSALVLGLGTGKTASELMARGLRVRVVEIDPAVVELATKWFDWRGDVVLADASEEVAKTDKKYDLVVIDTELRVGRSGTAFERPVLGVVGRVLEKDGVLATRFTSTPQVALEIAPALGEHYATYGNGLADEPQTIYGIGADSPLDLVLPPQVDVWRIARSIPGESVDPSLFDTTRGSSRERRVSIIGYLVRLSEDGTLAVDLPHAEMGAVRFRLSGELAAELQKKLPAKATFPTQGEIASDGEVTGTLEPLLGGGGWKRSDVRFSSVVVAIEGTARLRSDVSPDHAFGGNVLSRGGPSQEPVREKLLPYGGTLYDLDVTKVDWTLDAARFSDMKKAMLAEADKAAKLISAGKLADAAAVLEKGEGVFARISPDANARLPELRALHDLALRVKAEDERYTHATTHLAHGAACDRARGPVPRRPWLFPAPPAALYDCAVREYKAAFAKEQGSDDAKTAIARLLGLYDAEPWSNARASATETLKKRFPDVEPLGAPP